MRKREGMVLRQLGKESVIVAEGLDLIDFDKLVSLNSSAVYVWSSLPESGFDAETVAGLLTDRYEVEMSVALADARELLRVWLDAGIIEDR